MQISKKFFEARYVQIKNQEWELCLLRKTVLLDTEENQETQLLSWGWNRHGVGFQQTSLTTRLQWRASFGARILM